MSSLRPGEMQIGKLSKELGISTATINFYVAEEILPPPRKLNRTRAAYSERHLRLLRMVKRMQARGYSLELIRRAFAHFGTDEEGLKKLEGIGALSPLPPVRNDPRGEPIELFEPVAREELLQRAGVEAKVLDRLEGWGVLRPVSPGRYDAHDYHLLKTVQSLLDDGVPLERLSFLERLVPIARDMSWIFMDLARRYLPELRDRRRRVRDLIAPFTDILGYVFDRVNDEQHPQWRDMLFDDSQG